MRYNSQLYDLYENADIARKFKISRFRWAEHLCRRLENETTENPEIRKFGRPNLRRIDDIQ